MIKKAGSYNIQALFSQSNTLYQIPIYQRPYSWGKEECERLINDIRDNKKGYFICSTICITDEDSSIFDVVDGQQRFTTLLILISALINEIDDINKCCKDHGSHVLDIETEGGEFVHIYTNAKNILRDNTTKHNKLKLTHQNHDNDILSELFKYSLDKNSAKKSDIFGNENHLIYKAFIYFKKEIIALNNKQSYDPDNYKLGKDDCSLEKDKHIKKTFELLNKVIYATLVRIDVATSGDAFTLFSSINNRGLDLSLIDLIKNEFFSNEFSNNSTPAHQTTIDDQWNIFLERINNSDINDPDLHLRYLRHYLHAHEAKYVLTSQVLDRYKLRIKNNPQNEYSDFITSADIYSSIINKQCSNSSELDLLLAGFNEIGVSSSYALLLHVFHKLNNCIKASEVFLLKIVKLIESWYIRRNLTDFPVTRSLDNIFIEVIQMLSNLNCSSDLNQEHAKIESFLKNSKNWANSGKIDDILNGNMYKKNPSLVKYILIRLEQEKSKATWKNHAPCRLFDKIVVKNNKIQPVWTVEHIRPQNPDPNSDWILVPFKVSSGKIHNLGNLTITAYNSKLSNSSFESKKVEDFGYKKNGLKIDEYICAQTQWTDSEIDQRTQDLIKDIKQLFNW